MPGPSYLRLWSGTELPNVGIDLSFVLGRALEMRRQERSVLKERFILYDETLFQHER